jgi:hypothetical protein
VSLDDREPGSSDAGDHAVIDFVLSSPDGNEYVLVLVEDRPWSPGVIDQLTDRVNRSVAYVLEGDLALSFPETVGRDIRIHVDHSDPLDTDVEALFLRFEEALGQRGIEFSSQLLVDVADVPDSDAPDTGADSDT